MSLGLRLLLLFLAVFGCFAAYHLRRSQVERWLGLDAPPTAARLSRTSIERVPGVETPFTIRIEGSAPPVRPDPPSSNNSFASLQAADLLTSANPGESPHPLDDRDRDLEELPPYDEELPPYEDDPDPLVEEIGDATEEVPIEKPAPAVVLRSHIVQKNEKLWNIAEKYLGKGHRYPEIVELNASLLGGSEVIQPGMELRIPAK